MGSKLRSIPTPTKAATAIPFGSFKKKNAATFIGPSTQNSQISTHLGSEANDVIMSDTNEDDASVDVCMVLAPLTKGTYVERREECNITPPIVNTDRVHKGTVFSLRSYRNSPIPSTTGKSDTRANVTSPVKAMTKTEMANPAITASSPR